MMNVKEYQKDGLLREQLLQVLKDVDQDFYPSLSRRRPLDFWLDLFEKGTVLYALEENDIAGFLAYYPSLSGKVLDELRSCVNIDPVISPANTSEVYQEAYLHFIAVSPDHRGKKVASQLMSALLKDAQRKGVSKIRVVTWSSNIGSMRLYKKHGFHVFQKLPNDRGNGVGSIYLEAKIPYIRDLNRFNFLEAKIVERGSH
ncbi:MAG: GNAT family N-acetyltransferase [Candidatus Odinarchaeota archaeon]